MCESEVLLGKVAGGDQFAFQRLYDLFASAIFAVAVDRVGPGSEAERLAQDVFLQIWSRSGRFDPVVSSPVQWIGSVLRSTLTERLQVAAK